MDYAAGAQFVSNDLRLRTAPIAIKFLTDDSQFPDKVRRPSALLGKRITICQAVTLARLYRWTVGITGDDLICVPAMISFGFTKADDQMEALDELFCQVDFRKDDSDAPKEVQFMHHLKNREYPAIALAPLEKGLFEPDTIAFYGNPAQIMRLVQAWVYEKGGRVPGNFGGKVECTEYLIAPFKTGSARVAVPGLGDRIFSMTQDDEMVFSIPGKELETVISGMKTAGKKIGARYPVTFYQNFQPEFPDPYKKMGKKVGAFSD
ncbi:DUF169 domain-containing protein [Thermodesulfobacteriota bacterium]